MSTRPVRALVAHGPADLRVTTRQGRPPGPGEVAVRIRYGGICGSDLHYWRHGRVGDFALREPLVLGHEVVGTVEALGPGVRAASGMASAAGVGIEPAPGMPVAVHPATVCGFCAYCRAGCSNLCPDVRYLGSAARMPHVQGGFVEVLIVPAAQVVPLPKGLDLRAASIAEPAAVAWHALARAGNVRGRRVLVTGAGPIGSLVVAAASRAGAGEIVVTDIVPEPLAIARAVGAHRLVLVGQPEADPARVSDTVTAPSSAGALESPDVLDALDADVAIESSGTVAGLLTCVRSVRRGGRVVGLGLLPPGTVPMAANLVVTRELEFVGAFRFHEEFHGVLAALADGSLHAGPVVTHVMPLDAAEAAFALAGDPRRSGKVLLDLGQGDGVGMGGEAR